ncbi:ATP-binding protein [Caballeronia sp. LZ029]|uniref:ATP-binding protein n=1 Tax=Caballeronia sp. LZ029 TaxID=3038564 RepID=UPI0028620946|nr:ATP-binding protein [Caballeronia sp. LZ029]MDR5748911.1 ATP-binding protein [Caballeronia sp. LZ029]
MSKDIERPIPLDEHPLGRRIYRVPTPSIAAFRSLIDECLFLYITGALIHGRPRIGKSYAIEFIRRDLGHRQPKVSVYKMRCTRSQTASENNFFAALLHTVNHPAQSGASKTALRGRLLHKLRQVADKKGDDRVVLFADEAQNLREIEYEWLRDLHDEMENNALRLFTFLVGQPQLLAQKSAFQAQDKEQIVARFMVEELAFRGIVSAAECAAVLSAYDHGEYPEHSGWSAQSTCSRPAYRGIRWPAVGCLRGRTHQGQPGWPGRDSNEILHRSGRGGIVAERQQGQRDPAFRRRILGRDGGAQPVCDGTKSGAFVVIGNHWPLIGRTRS